jgi:ABC-type dipeptide/oligopeptide/nickel transport system permease subunit
MSGELQRHAADADADQLLDDEISLEMNEVVGLSQAQIVRRRFFRHRGAMLSLTILAFIIVLSATSVGWGPIPGWWKWEYNELVPRVEGDGGPTLSFRPTWLGGAGIMLGDHPFGVDNEVGKDMFAQTMRGVQTSLAIIIVLGVLSTTIGVVIGALSGYYGRWVDSALMRFTDVIIVLPLLVITAVAGFALGLSGMWPVAIALGVFTWTGLARLVRAEFLALREREFVDAARVANASDRRIIFKHILPNTVGTIVVSTTLLMGAGILTEAALGFLGFGVRAPAVSLGSLVNDYQGAYETRPWLFIWPGVFVVAIVLCLQFIGDGLRDAFDPRQKRIPKHKDLEREGELTHVTPAAAGVLGEEENPR